jgi:hypothetical protein
VARKATCPKCNQIIEPNENTKVYKNKKYHIKCYKELVDELYNKSKTSQDIKQELYDYICRIFNLKEITPLIKIQLDKYYTEYEFTYEGMLYTLKYFFDVMENDVGKCEGIGIIPYVYQEAKEFYVLKDHLYDLEIIENPIENKIVKIKPINYSQTKLIDINNL